MGNHRFLENKFKDEIERHLKNALPNLYGTHIIFRQADDYEDGNLCFDLVFNFNFTVSIRVRKNKYIRFNDLTIRSRSKLGNKTELDKIKEGMSQVYFYAYMNKEENRLEKVRIADVDAIRKLIKEGSFIGPIPNNDGTEFISFKFKDIKNKGGAIYKFN